MAYDPMAYVGDEPPYEGVADTSNIDFAAASAAYQQSLAQLLGETPIPASLVGKVEPETWLALSEIQELLTDRQVNGHDGTPLAEVELHHSSSARLNEAGEVYLELSVQHWSSEVRQALQERGFRIDESMFVDLEILGGEGRGPLYNQVYGWLDARQVEARSELPEIEHLSIPRNLTFFGKAVSSVARPYVTTDHAHSERVATSALIGDNLADKPNNARQTISGNTDTASSELSLNLVAATQQLYSSSNSRLLGLTDPVIWLFDQDVALIATDVNYSLGDRQQDDASGFAFFGYYIRPQDFRQTNQFEQREIGNEDVPTILVSAITADEAGLQWGDQLGVSIPDYDMDGFLFLNGLLR